MIKVLLNHYIYEMCIEVLFKPIIESFTMKPYICTVYDLHEGQIFSKIVSKSHNNAFLNCRITGVNTKDYTFKNGFIWFDYDIYDIEMKGTGFYFNDIELFK